MIIADLAQIAGRTYPARRRTQNLVGGASPIQATNFSMGNVTLEPNGGQVPWHNQEQEEIYFIVEGTGEMCLGEERIDASTAGRRSTFRTGLPSVDQHRRNAAAHDLLLRSGGRRGPLAPGTRRHAAPAGVEVPALPAGARPQCTKDRKPDRTYMSQQTIHSVGIIMNGVTGRMGLNQHLRRSIYAIMQQGGVRLGRAETIMPKPMLVGRNAAKLEAIAPNAAASPGPPISMPRSPIPDTPSTSTRKPPTAAPTRAQSHRRGQDTSTARSRSPTASRSRSNFYRLAEKAGVKHGVVQDKLWLPGMLKLKTLSELGFFGRILRVRGEFGYWVFEGDTVPAQRPSWNYRKEDGGGIIIDMLCHWRYVLDNLFGPVKAVSCLGATHIPTRWDEAGKPYDCTADDSAYATFELGRRRHRAHFNSSWCVRVRRDDLLTIQVDGTKGSRGRRPAPLLDPALRRDAAARLEPRYREPAQLLRRLAEGARSRTPSTTPSSSSGSCSCGTSSRTSLSAGPCSKAPRACNSPKKASNPGKSAPGYRSRICASLELEFAAPARIIKPGTLKRGEIYAPEKSHRTFGRDSRPDCRRSGPNPAARRSKGNLHRRSHGVCLSERPARFAVSG